MGYFFTASDTNTSDVNTDDTIIMTSNILPYCVEEYKIDLGGKQLNLLQLKAGLYDKKIAEKNKRIYDIIDMMDDYYKNNGHDDNYNTYLNIRNSIKNKEEEDKKFFTSASTDNYFLDGEIIVVKYLDFLNEIVSDFNSNFFDYYLMAQHSEQYNCCFMYNFRKTATLFSRTINCQFFYCHFDRGVKSYIDDISSIEFDTTINDDDTESIDTADQVSNNIDNLRNYITYRSNFEQDLHNFYNDLYEFLKPYTQFLVHLKFLLKIIAVVSIVVNSHGDDAQMFKNFANNIVNLMKGNILDSTPATQSNYYYLLIYIFQTDTIPYVVDMKVRLEKSKLTLSEKEKANKMLSLFAIADVGILEKCQNLYSITDRRLKELTKDKKAYFDTLSEDDRNKFLAKAYVNKDNLNVCYFIDYDTEYKIEDIKEIKDEVDGES